MLFPLAGTELSVHPLCLGGNVFGWTADQEQSFEVLDAYAEAGGNFLDTSDSYTWKVPGNSGGESETTIGNWMAVRKNRDSMVVATKVGNLPKRRGLRATNIATAVEDSLIRLRTDYLDVYYAHIDDQDTPLEETLGAFTALVEAGKVRHLAASNYTATRLSEALKISDENGFGKYALIQPHYNMMERDYEHDLRPVAAEHGVACLPYYALAKGFLTGKYRADTPAEGARAAGAMEYMDDRGRLVLGELAAIAEAHQVRQGAVALAWLAAQPTVATPIASARNVAQLNDLLPMADLQLTEDEIARLSQASKD